MPGSSAISSPSPSAIARSPSTAHPADAAIRARAHGSRDDSCRVENECAENAMEVAPCPREQSYLRSRL
jgi:hypothetical protein